MRNQQNLLGVLGALLFATTALVSPQPTAAAEPPPINYCGPDQINLSGHAGSAATTVVQPGRFDGNAPAAHTRPSVEQPEVFDSFEFIDHGGACGMRQIVTSYTNNTSVAQKHKFTDQSSATTTFSAQVSGGFKDAFSASMGFEAQVTHTATYESELEIPPGKTIILSAFPSFDIYNGIWKCWNCQPIYIQVIRPNGHFTWHSDEE